MGDALDIACGVSVTPSQPRRTLRVKREIFLDHFSASCDVAAAAATAGVSPQTIYRWRRTEPDFAEQWAQALVLGLQMVEARLIAHVLAGGTSGAGAAGDAAGVEPLRVEEAYRVLTLRKSGAGAGSRGAPRKTVTPEETDRRLMEKLDALARRNRAEAARSGATEA